MTEPALLARADVEDFLFAEAALLDDDRFDDWLALWLDDAASRYIVPALDAPGGDPRTTLTLVFDDLPQLRTRVKQLATGTTWAEVPRSKTQRMVGNVRLLAQDAATVSVSAKFVVHRFRPGAHGRADSFAGTYRYELARTAAGLRIREKRCVLAHDSLLQQGSLSMLL